MSLKITNKTNESLQEVHELVNKFFPYAQKRLGFNRPVALSFISDSHNASNPLGKTAYYDPNQDEISIYIDKRHPKDILRSFSHELIHHNQNCRGEFEGDHVTEEGYAQKDEHLRNMEKEAYLEGNLLIRDWEDGIKYKSRSTTMSEQLIKHITERVLEELKNNKKADLDKDGKLSSYEKKRGAAIEKSMAGDDDETVDEAHCGKRDDDDVNEEVENLEERRRGNSEDRRGHDKPADRVKALEETEDVTEGEEVVEEEEELEERRRADSEDRRGHDKPEDRKKPLEEGKTFEQRKEERLYNALMKKWVK